MGFPIPTGLHFCLPFHQSTKTELRILEKLPPYMAARCPCWSRLQSSFSIRIVCQIWPHTFRNWKKWRFFFGSWTENRGGRGKGIVHITMKHESCVTTKLTKALLLWGACYCLQSLELDNPCAVPPAYQNQTLPFFSHFDKLNKWQSILLFLQSQYAKAPSTLCTWQTTEHGHSSQQTPPLHIHARGSPYGCSQHFLDEDARPPEPHRKPSCYQRGRGGLCLQLQYHSPAEDKRPD